ncbi:MAG: 3-dehydroquinate synthase [Planctomycetota bacterium]
MTNVDVPFAVNFTHRLRHTRDVAGEDFDVLADVLAGELESPGAATRTPSKVLLWYDKSLTGFSSDSGCFVARLHARLRDCVGLDLRGDPHAIVGGEACKNSESELRALLDLINDHDLDRRSYIIVAGGGAVLDVAGYVAAIAHRGIRLVRLPSTTLAQGDSGVGVKNAINYFGKKNWIGSFAVPWAVINDATILDTLPDRDFRSGFTEAVKVALLKDADLFATLRQHAEAIAARDSRWCHEVIARSCRLHLDHITLGGDPFESLEARPLDFGHWSAHKLEPMTKYRLRHGEAVGIGVALDTLYSSAALGFPDELALEVCRVLHRIGTPLWCDALGEPDRVLRGLEEFRQHLGGRLTITMLRGVGDMINVHAIDEDIMKQCILRLRGIASEWGHGAAS